MAWAAKSQDLGGVPVKYELRLSIAQVHIFAARF